MNNRFFLFTLGFFLKLMIFSQILIPGDYINHINKEIDSTNLSLYPSIYANNSSAVFEWINPFIKTSYNTTYPRGYNDGAIWKGKGLTLEAHFGFKGKKGKFTYTVYPNIFFSQNSPFTLVDHPNNRLSPFAYPFSDKIDWVQSYGDKSYISIHPGQSEGKFQTGKFIISVSTQNYSLGPSTFNPILLSRQSGGFTHLKIGAEPFNIKIKDKMIGKFEVNAIFGLLKESNYYDEDASNDHRYLNGLFFAFSPNFLPELTVGFNKILYKQTQFFEIEDLISVIKVLDNGVKNGNKLSVNDTFDQLASLSIEWDFPKVGFRAYGELAKNDFDGPMSTFFEPEHTRAYTLGFEKMIVLKKNKTLTIEYEHTNLSRNQAWLWRATPSYYAHSVNKQGYTNNGQIIGAGIGLGGNSDNVGVRIKKIKQQWAFLLQRIESNRDYFTQNIQKIADHDIEYSLGCYFQKENNKMIWAIEHTMSYNYNRYYRADKPNLYFGFSVLLKMN